MCRETEDNLALARAYHNLGMTHADLRDWNAAMACFDSAYNLADEQGQLDVVANVLLSRAEMLLDLGDCSMSASFCGRVLEVYKKTGNRIGEADTYRLLGRAFTLRHDWTSATGLFRDSIRLNEEFSHPLGLAEAHRDLGRMHAARGHVTDARASYESALAGFRRLGAQADVAAVEGLVEDLEE